MQQWTGNFVQYFGETPHATLDLRNLNPAINGVIGPNHLLLALALVKYTLQKIQALWFGDVMRKLLKNGLGQS